MKLLLLQAHLLKLGRSIQNRVLRNAFIHTLHVIGKMSVATIKIVILDLLGIGVVVLGVGVGGSYVRLKHP